MFTISSESDYGLIILSSLLKSDSYVSLTDVIQQTDLPKRYLAQIAGTLVKHGLLTSHEVKNMSLFEYLMIFEKNVEVSKCCVKAFACHFMRICKHGNFFQHKLTNVLSNQLKNIKLVEIFEK
jgi:DNA-binding IscR family transcriptional regulator